MFQTYITLTVYLTITVIRFDAIFSSANSDEIGRHET